MLAGAPLGFGQLIRTAGLHFDNSADSHRQIGKLRDIR